MFYNGNNLSDVLKEQEEFINNGMFVSDRFAKKQAIFRNSVIQNLTLSDINLSYADFSGCVLVNFYVVNCNLSNASFVKTTMCDCNFSSTEFNSASFVDATAINTTFCMSDFTGANLTHAVFRRCPLMHSTMKDVVFSQTSIDFSKSHLILDMPEFPVACPDTGSFTGWKKCYVYTNTKNFGRKVTPVLVKLRIPDSAERVSSGGVKCRCSEAYVDDIQYLDGTHCDLPAHSSYMDDFIYRIGHIVKPNKPFDCDPFVECASGIHFFISRVEAANYKI